MSTVRELAKDLNKEPPRSPYEVIGGFALLARTIDKCRAYIASTEGEYHFNCPLDRMLFSFKGIDAEEFKDFVDTGVSDEEIGAWVHAKGKPKTFEEICTWSESMKGRFDHVLKDDKESFRGC